MKSTAVLFLAILFLLHAPVQASLPADLQVPVLQDQKPFKLEWSQLEKNQTAWVLVFLSAKCPCSDSHIVELKKIYKDFPEFKFVAIHSNPDESLELARKYFKEKDLPFVVVQDDHTQVADLLKALKTPHAYVVSSKGEILFQGGVTNSANAPQADKHFLADALSDLKAGKEVRLKNARTLGCIIQREGEKNSW